MISVFCAATSTPDKLCEQLKLTVVDADTGRQQVAAKLKEQNADSDICVGRTFVSLNCPLSCCRVRLLFLETRGHCWGLKYLAPAKYFSPQHCPLSGDAVCVPIYADMRVFCDVITFQGTVADPVLKLHAFAVL